MHIYPLTAIEISSDHRLSWSNWLGTLELVLRLAPQIVAKLDHNDHARW